MQNYACGYVDEPHLPQSGTAENVHAAGAGRESRKRSGQNRERLAVLRVAGTGGDRRNTSGLCGAYDACRSTPQEKPTRKTDKKSLRKEQIWEFCQEPRSASEILELLGLRNKENLMEIYLTPMLKAGMLTMTEPETPTSRNQKYKAVEHGQ